MDQALNDAFRYKLPERDSVHPTLFIGLGGAGGAMVDRILAKLDTRWDKQKFGALYHGFALDTDTAALARYSRIPEGNRILLSNFDKRWYAESKRGSSYLDADPLFTQWAHPWYGFRAESGVGAGQIRLESRMSLYYQLENDHAGIVRALQDCIRTALHHDNPFRLTSPLQFNVHILCSIAGGTGSGAFLSFAYLVRRLIEEAGNTAKTTGYLMLPGPFFPAVPQSQHIEIDANSYAALKELEHLMALGLERGEGKHSETFHYSGYHRGETTVDRAPFNFAYLLGTPQGSVASTLSEYCDAVADALFVQFFSPIMGVQNSQWDNSSKLVSSGTATGYSLNYGTCGSNVLILPARDILEYCAHRYALDAIDRFMLQRDISGDAATAGFAVRTDTPEWHQLTPARRAERLDDAFIGFVDYIASNERQRSPEGGVFEAVRRGLSAVTEQPLADAFRAETGRLLDGLTGQISLDRPSEYAFHERDYDVRVPAQRLTSQVTRTRNAVDAAWANLRVDLTNGQMLRRFFDEHQVSLLGQRYLLIGLARTLRERLGWLSAEVSKRRTNADLDSAEISRELDTNQERLKSTAPQTLIERFKRNNDDFTEARAAFLSWFNTTLVQGWHELLKLECEQKLTEALVKRVESLLQVFRDLIDQTVDARDRLERQSAHILRTGGLVAGDSESNLFAFDTEALRDEGAGRRLWDHYYEREFSNQNAWFSPDEVLPAINRAFDPVADEHGELRQPDVGTIAGRIVAGLLDAGREKLTAPIMGTEALSDDRSKLGLMLDDALNLEARIVLKLSDPTLSEADEKAARDYIDAKLAHAVRKAAVLCTINAPALDSSIAEDAFSMACLHPAYERSLALNLGERHKCKIITSWFDPRTVLLYSARMGIPLFWVRSVNERMKPAYRAVQKAKVDTRRYPLHIESAWEYGLDDLDPLERAQEHQAAELDEVHVRFAFCRIGGVIHKDDTSWRITLGGFDKALGASLPKALEAMESMREDLAKRLDGPMAALRAELQSPNEAASAWEPVLTYLKEISNECLSLPESNLLHRHHEVISNYVRHYAPADVHTVADPYLAPIAGS